MVQVYFMSKPFYPNVSQDHLWPNSYRDVPSLLYTTFGWNDKAKDEWFNTNVWERRQSLRAHRAGIPSHVPVMPIGLYWSPSNATLDNIRFLKPGLGSSILTYNQNGTLHLGFLQDLANQATWLDMPPDSAVCSCWQADLANVTAYRMRTGVQIAQTLDSMWVEMRKESLSFYHEVSAMANSAHEECVGQYSGYCELGVCKSSRRYCRGH